MKKQKKIEDNLTLLYEKHPEAFELKNIKKLIWYYWKHVDGIIADNQLTAECFLQATSPESITRARRWVVEKNNKKDPESVEKEKDYTLYYSQKKLQIRDSGASQKEGVCKDCGATEGIFQVVDEYICHLCYNNRVKEAIKISQ